MLSTIASTAVTERITAKGRRMLDGPFNYSGPVRQDTFELLVHLTETSYRDTLQAHRWRLKFANALAPSQDTNDYPVAWSAHQSILAKHGSVLEVACDHAGSEEKMCGRLVKVHDESAQICCSRYVPKYRSGIECRPLLCASISDERKPFGRNLRLWLQRHYARATGVVGLCNGDGMRWDGMGWNGMV